MTDKFIFKGNQLVNKNIMISCNENWSQEEIGILIKYFLMQFDQFEEVERLQGADREQVRLLWQNFHFNLQFECYSESIWITSEDELADRELMNLYHYLLGD